MVKLMSQTYQRHWWFFLIREPLVCGMLFLAWVNHLPIKTYAAKNPECRGCLRFIKAELEVKSGTFRLLNRFIGPLFNKIRDPRLVPEEVAEAKAIAAEMMKGLESGSAENLAPEAYDANLSEVQTEPEPKDAEGQSDPARKT
jgi:hypothetical protein